MTQKLHLLYYFTIKDITSKCYSVDQHNSQCSVHRSIIMAMKELIMCTTMHVTTRFTKQKQSLMA
jgi:hypothetical protein